jgi:hypothetical protein
MEQVIEATHNEIAWLRASYYAVNGGEKAVYEPHIYRDPLDEKVLAEQAAEEAAEAQRSEQEFNAQIGYS